MTVGLCDACRGMKRLTDRGLVPVHYLSIPVSARAVRSVGTGRVRRRCPGSGKAPGRTVGR
jgi:hypothetical protein